MPGPVLSSQWTPEVNMLDAYIIERIRRERDTERQRGAVIPLHIEVPRRQPEAKEDQREEEEERGSVVIDYQL